MVSSSRSACQTSLCCNNGRMDRVGRSLLEREGVWVMRYVAALDRQTAAPGLRCQGGSKRVGQHGRGSWYSCPVTTTHRLSARKRSQPMDILDGGGRSNLQLITTFYYMTLMSNDIRSNKRHHPPSCGGCANTIRYDTIFLTIDEFLRVLSLLRS